MYLSSAKEVASPLKAPSKRVQGTESLLSTGLVQWVRASLKRMRASVQQDTRAKKTRMMAVAQAADRVAQSTDAAWPSLAEPKQCNATHKVCALVPAFSSHERMPQDRASHRPQAGSR